MHSSIRCKWHRALFCYSNLSIRHGPTVTVSLLAGCYAQAVGLHAQRDTKRQTYTTSVESTNIASQLISFLHNSMYSSQYTLYVACKMSIQWQPGNVRSLEEVAYVTNSCSPDIYNIQCFSKIKHCELNHVLVTSNTVLTAQVIYNTYVQALPQSQILSR